MSDHDLRAAAREAACGDALSGERAFAQHVRQGHLGLAAELLLRFPEQSARGLAGLIPSEVLMRLTEAWRPHLEDPLGHVRQRPVMYVGDVGEAGLHQLLEETLDTALDRTHGRDQATIRIELDGERIVVEDDGLPLPIETLPHRLGEEGLAWALVLGPDRLRDWTRWHRGGLHGTGLFVVNALTTRFAVEIRRPEDTWRQVFQRGAPAGPLRRDAATPPVGCRLELTPDPAIFRGRWVPQRIVARLEELAWLRPETRFVWRHAGQERELTAPDGLGAWVARQAPQRLTETTFSCRATVEDPTLGPVQVDAALSYRSGHDESERLASWANLVSLPEGGTALAGLRTGVQEGGLRWLGTHARRGLRRPDFTRGLVGGVSVLLANPTYMGPLRNAIANPELQSIVARVVGPAFARWLAQRPPAEVATLRRRVCGR